MFRSLLLGSLLTLWTGLAGASGIDQLHRFLEGLRGMQADFEQSVTSSDQPKALYSRGTFYLQRPGLFRWDYLDPAGQFVIADGKRVWLYDADLNQVSHQNQEAALRGTPALLLSDTGPLEKHFSLVNLGLREDLEWVELIPQTQETEVAKVQAGFAGERLERLEMLDTFGRTTRFRFSRIQRNPSLDQNLFRFTPPPGTDILER